MRTRRVLCVSVVGRRSRGRAPEPSADSTGTLVGQVRPRARCVRSCTLETVGRSIGSRFRDAHGPGAKPGCGPGPDGRGCSVRQSRPHRARSFPTSPPRRDLLLVLRLRRRVRAVLQPLPAVDRSGGVADRAAAVAHAAHADRRAASVGVASGPPRLAGAAPPGHARCCDRCLFGRVRNHGLRGPLRGAGGVCVLLERDDAARRGDHAHRLARAFRALRCDPVVGVGGFHRRGTRRRLDARPGRDRESAVAAAPAARRDARVGVDRCGTRRRRPPPRRSAFSRTCCVRKWWRCSARTC